MRISDWSSDVCSSDLVAERLLRLSWMMVRSIRRTRFCKSRKLASTCLSPPPLVTRSRLSGDSLGRRSFRLPERDRELVVTGKSVSVGVELGGRRIIKKKKKNKERTRKILTKKKY